ncbi:MAG TPA: flagella basal body P-ring formation protein FlgA [Terriglobales bacterium]|nr:flagella basal body P-ring formation protein FlgA [Terriglobales bacterium]
MLEKFSKLTWLVILFPTLVQLAVGQNGPRTSISEERVAKAITSAGIYVLPGQVEFLSDLGATTRDVVLQVIGATPKTGSTAIVELRCRDHRECLPFYVLVHGMTAIHSSNGSHAPLQLASLKDRAQGTLSPQLVRSGDHATLILETADSRISMPVICLQSGWRGETIRVRSNDGKRLYRGEVVASSLLKGSL